MHKQFVVAFWQSSRSLPPSKPGLSTSPSTASDCQPRHGRGPVPHHSARRQPRPARRRHHRARGHLPRTHQPAARRRVGRETHRLSGRARREARHHRIGAGQELGEGPGRRLEGRPCPTHSSATSIPTAISSTATGSILWAASITPARSTCTATGWPRRRRSKT